MFEFRATLAARSFDVALSMEPGETIAVLGANGAGKSTLLALIAGLLRPDSGAMALDDEITFDATRFQPPYRRNVALLAQEALLFPHLSVLDNVAFGPQSRGVSRSVARATSRHWLEQVDALEFAERKPAQLSGGQAQRIAVARALAASPQLLLLDEPMAALDVTIVPALRGMLHRVLRDRTAIIVTHDVIDAYTLADRVIVLRDGHVVDAGPTREVLARPRDAFAAALVGLNFLTGRSTTGGVIIAGVELKTAVPLPAGQDVAVTIAPASVALSALPLAGPNVIEGTVEGIESRGDVVRVHVAGIAADVSPAELTLFPGDPAWLHLPPGALTLRAVR
jgi:molybdate transport system ATP-binding protein